MRAGSRRDTPKPSAAALIVLLAVFCCCCAVDWTTGSPIPSFVGGSGAVAVGNFVHYVNIDSHFKYEVEADAWASVTPQPKNQRISPAVAAVGTHIYIMSGFAPGQGFFTNNEKYDTVADTWVTATAVPSAQEGPTAASDRVARIWLTAGWTGGPMSNTHHVYNAAADTFAQLAPVPTAGCCGGRAYASGYVVSVAGQTQGVLVELYDVGADTWTTGSPSPTNRNQIFGGLSSLGSWVYVAGGTTGGSSFNKYNPVDDEWVLLDPLPLVHTQASLAVSTGGTAVVIGSHPAAVVVHQAVVLSSAELQGDPELTSFLGQRLHAWLFAGVFTLFASNSLTVNVLVDHHPLLPPDENLVVFSVGYTARHSMGFCSTEFEGVGAYCWTTNATLDSADTTLIPLDDYTLKVKFTDTNVVVVDQSGSHQRAYDRAVFLDIELVPLHHRVGTASGLLGDLERISPSEVQARIATGEYSVSDHVWGKSPSSTV